MAFQRRLIHSLLAGLTTVGLISGCCSNGHCRKIRLPRCPWPQNWARPAWLPGSEGPPLPVPADPSGSPYAPQSPRGLYVPSGPAPESKLGLPTPPPLQPSTEDLPPQPESESLPPDVEDLDVSYQNNRRQPVIAPPPPEEIQPLRPQVAERSNLQDRFHQPVRLGLPEIDQEPSVTAERPRDDLFRDSSTIQRSPVDTFPQPERSEPGIRRRTPLIDDNEIESEEMEEEYLPESLDSSSRRFQPTPAEALPQLTEPEEDLSFPGVNRQTSASAATRTKRVERLSNLVTVENFCLTRDVLPGSYDILSAKSLRRGQRVVVRADFIGLKRTPHNGDMVSRTTHHCEIRDARKTLLHATKAVNSSEANMNAAAIRNLQTALVIPSDIKPGNHVLQLHLKDNVSGRTTSVQMPIVVK